MKCETCGAEMEALLTSVYCPEEEHHESEDIPPMIYASFDYLGLPSPTITYCMPADDDPYGWYAIEKATD